MPYKYNDALDDPLMFEHIKHWRGGMNAEGRETELPPEVSPRLQDVLLSSSGHPKNRPGYTTLGTAPEASALPQGLFYFDAPGVERLFLVKNKKLHLWNGTNWSSEAGWTMASASAAVAMAQGSDYLYVSDGTNQWRRHNGSTLSGALGNVLGTTGDPPVGATMLCWHTFRMFAAGVAAEPDALWASNLFTATTGQWDHTNFKCRVGYGEGQAIMGLVSLQDYTLVVPKASSIYLVRTDPTAATSASSPDMTASEWPIFKLTDGLGQVGTRAGCVLGNDYLFMSQDGVRTVRRMESAAGQYELSPPLSSPIQPYIDRINWSYAAKIVAWSYKQYAFFAVPLDNASSPNTVFVWDGRLSVWAAIFTAWTPQCWGTTRFADAHRLVWGDAAGSVRQWLDYTDPDLDSTYLDGATAIPAIVRSKSWTYGALENEKDPAYAELQFRSGRGTVAISFVADNEVRKQWSSSLQRTAGMILPFVLPATIAPGTIIPVRQALEGVGLFKEAYLEVRSSSGFMDLRSMSLASYLSTTTNE